MPSLPRGWLPKVYTRWPGCGLSPASGQSDDAPWQLVDFDQSQVDVRIAVDDLADQGLDISKVIVALQGRLLPVFATGK